MSEDRRYVRIELPGETVILDVPAIPASKDFRPWSVGCVVNMTYDDGKHGPIVIHTLDTES